MTQIDIDTKVKNLKDEIMALKLALTPNSSERVLSDYEKSNVIRFISNSLKLALEAKTQGHSLYVNFQIDFLKNYPTESLKRQLDKIIDETSENPQDEDQLMEFYKKLQFKIANLKL
ncbi:hypothetical protein [Lacibacter sp.]|uniref:hypothetical protein n=1 Tax=Lacibacter sp. TaxID=1915409 RepID=UPI002B4B0C9D|nr:hypothetical protein [Lacibacter sp.]HLP39781.1 hypothetical protein [Lacibacter sp.]